MGNRPTPGFVKRPPPSPLPPRPYVRPVEAWVTCSGCSRISTSNLTLDGQSICHSCLHQKRFGDKIKECAERGYHETSGFSSNGFRSELHCACNITARYHHGGQVGPLSVDDYPKRWKLVNGELQPVFSEAH